MNHKSIVRINHLLAQIEKAKNKNNRNNRNRTIPKKFSISIKIYCPREIEEIRAAGYEVCPAGKRHWIKVSD